MQLLQHQINRFSRLRAAPRGRHAGEIEEFDGDVVLGPLFRKAAVREVDGGDVEGGGFAGSPSCVRGLEFGGRGGGGGAVGGGGGGVGGGLRDEEVGAERVGEFGVGFLDARAADHGGAAAHDVAWTGLACWRTGRLGVAYEVDSMSFILRDGLTARGRACP